MTYAIEINTDDGWQRLKPMGTKAVQYMYNTRDQAERVLYLCYPDELPWNVRVVENK